MTTLRRDRVVSLDAARSCRDVELCERALAGDVDAAIWWLTKYGGPEWQVRSDLATERA
jgi:hypothetical protein